MKTNYLYAELDDDTCNDLNFVVPLMDISVKEEVNCTTLEENHLLENLAEKFIEDKAIEVYLWEFFDMDFQCFEYDGKWYFFKYDGATVYVIDTNTSDKVEVTIYRCGADTVLNLQNSVITNMGYRNIYETGLTCCVTFNNGKPESIE